jgi:hypothetical protein
VNLPLLATLVVAFVCFAPGCSTPDKSGARFNPARNDPAAKLTIQAGEYLMLMKKMGQLPGVTPYEKGELETPAISSQMVAREQYPVSRRFGLTKQGEPDFHYRYTLTKASAGAGWRLTGATMWNPATQKEIPLVGR